MFCDHAGKVLYVGKASNLKKRVSSYFKGAVDNKTSIMLSKAKNIDFVITTSELDAFLLEANLIKKYRPFYNIKLSDDKFFPYIKISKGNIPHLIITRKKVEKNADYFGPYPSTTSLKTVLKIIRRIFPFQSVVNHTKRVCFYNHLGLCPCIEAFPENRNEYLKNLRRIKSFLKGNKEVLIKQLEREREDLSKIEEYEKASVIQEKINSINLITSEFYEPFIYDSDPLIAHTKTQSELSSLKQILLPYYPEINNLSRIECYDISNIQGKFATGSLVVLTNGEIDKKSYRRFRIQIKSTPDDFLMMSEMFTRRFKHPEWGTPSLLVVDGGKGQVSSVIKVLQNLKLQFPLIGLAKREEIIVIPRVNNGQTDFLETRLPKSNPGINLLRRIRDEAHRFAITYHKLLRKKNFIPPHEKADTKARL